MPVKEEAFTHSTLSQYENPLAIISKINNIPKSGVADFVIYQMMTPLFYL